MYCPAVIDSGAMGMFRSISSLCRRCDECIHFSAFWRIVATQCSSPTSTAYRNIFAVALVGEDVGLSKAVGPGR